MSIYKPCDIRGDAEEELTPELYRQWGAALGLQVPAKAKFVVGGDVRASTPEFLKGLIEGLCQAGVDPVDLGILPTPMVYHAKRRIGAAACAIVTASHNPAEINGLKWMIGNVPPTQADVRKLKQAAVEGPAACEKREHCQPRTLDISFDYVAMLQESWMDVPPIGRPIVIDAMHGVWASRARRYLQAVFPRTLFSAIHDAPDAEFGGQPPDCSQHELLEDLSDAVYHHRAAMGLAFDGDGDRVAFVDDEGNALSPEEAAWILLQSMALDLPGQGFVYDHKFADGIPQAARELGAEPLPEQTGHAFVRSRMATTGARFGAETSGHYFFRELGGGDDGLFAACRMIAFVARSGDLLSELRREAPEAFITPELRVGVKSKHHADVLRQVREAFAEYPQTDFGGVRVNLPEGWALVRSSITEPAMKFRFESSDWNRLAKLVWRFTSALPGVGEAIWHRYEEAMGSHE